MLRDLAKNMGLDSRFRSPRCSSGEAGGNDNEGGIIHPILQ